MPRQFAKLFGPPDDQILVTLDVSIDDGHSPEVRLYFPAPVGLGYAVLRHLPNADGEALAALQFDLMTEQRARLVLDAARAKKALELSAPGSVQ